MWDGYLSYQFLFHLDFVVFAIKCPYTNDILIKQAASREVEYT